MKLERLLKLAGMDEDQIEESMAKYNEPKANHAKKSFASDEAHAKGHDNPKALHGDGKKPSKGKYNEPHATHAHKTGAKDKAGYKKGNGGKGIGGDKGGMHCDAPEGDLGNAGTKPYKSHTSTK